MRMRKLQGLLTKSGPPKEIAESFSMRLLKALQRRGRISEIPRMSQWNRHFAELLKRVPSEQVEKVLAWYVTKVGEDYIPEVYDAEGFRYKFSQILEHYQDDPASLTITPVAANIARAVLEEFPLGREIGERIPFIIQKSIDFYGPFWGRVGELWTTLREAESDNSSRWDGSLLGHLIESGFFVGPESFVRYVWMRAVCGEYERRNGGFPVRYMPWRIQSSVFKDIGQRKAKEYTGDHKRWDTLARHWEDW